MNSQLARDIGDPFKGFGALGLETKTPEDAPAVFNTFLSAVIGLLTIIASIWFIFLFISGSISYMSAGGDKGKIESATKKMSTGLIGLAIVVAAIFVINFIGWAFGLEFILNPASFVEGLL